MNDIEPNRNNKNLIIWGAMVLIVVAIIWFAMSNRSAKAPGLDNSRDQESTQDEGRDSSESTSDSKETEQEADTNRLRGILLESDDLDRGNLLLVRLEGDIYLNTSRDYSSLLNQEVVVKIEGSLDKFRLLDIEAD